MNFENITLEQLAAIVSSKLKEHKIDTILVGGGCVSIYSENQYQSYDLDFVTYDNMKMVKLALQELGFEKKRASFYPYKLPVLPRVCGSSCSDWQRAN